VLTPLRRYVAVVHRSDCCGDRLKGAQIFFSAKDSVAEAVKGTACDALSVASALPGARDVVTCAAAASAGRYAFVYHATLAGMSICEFQVRTLPLLLSLLLRRRICCSY